MHCINSNCESSMPDVLRKLMSSSALRFCSPINLICSCFLFWLKGRPMRNKQFTLSEEFERPICQGDIEEDSYRRGFRCIAGLDEVGRGPLAGPVVAAAVVLPRGFTHLEIKDSKLLTPEQRETLLPVI